MKRHIQKLGVRRWFGDDLIDLQAETLKAIEGLLQPYSSCILNGCKVEDDIEDERKKMITPGLVLFTWEEESQKHSVVAEFEGISNLNEPFNKYLTLETVEITRQYDDGLTKPIAIHKKAIITSVEPSGPYIEITENNENNPTFRDALQSSKYRFVKDADITYWNHKYDSDNLVINEQIHSEIDVNVWLSLIRKGNSGIITIVFTATQGNYNLNQIIPAQYKPDVIIYNNFGSYNSIVQVLTDGSIYIANQEPTKCGSSLSYRVTF